MFDVDFFGHNYRGILDDFIDREVYIYGGYELNTLALMSQLAKAIRAKKTGPVTYVDVGANTGQHALFMSRHADSVICFEPFQSVRMRLEERVASNNIHNVSVLPVALSDQNGTSFYYAPDGNNQGTGTLVPELSVGSRSAPIEVRTDVGDNYFADCSGSGISILKIDVEGSELGVLEGLRKTLQRCRPAVILELSEFTRAKIGSLGRLCQLLYSDAVAFTIGKTPWRVDYTLRECDFKAPSNILIIPSEFSGLVSRCASFARATDLSGLADRPAPTLNERRNQSRSV
jgi:FkbM family methyltransferase